MIGFIVNSIFLGVGLAMDAFSVSIADAMSEKQMSVGRKCLFAGTFAYFQFIMPVIGWICVHTIVTEFKYFQKLIPWIALILLLYIGIKMIYEGLRNSKKAKTGEKIQKRITGIKELIVQGVATSIDALSVGFTIAEYKACAAVVCSIIIAIVTFIICMIGLFIGRIVGNKITGKADILGGVILVAIGIEIFIQGIF